MKALKKYLPFAVFLLLSLISVLIWRKVNTDYHRLVHEHTYGLAKQVALRLSDAIRLRLGTLEAFSNTLTSYGDWTDARLENNLSMLTSGLPGYQAINWIDSAGVIRRVYPVDDNLAALNKNLRHHFEADVRETFGLAEKTKRFAITPVIELWQGGLGLASYWPIIADDGTLSGYLNGVFRVKPLVEACLPKVEGESLHFILMEKDKVIYFSDESMREFTAAAEEEGWHKLITTELTFYGRTWKMSMVPVQMYTSDIEKSMSWLTLIFGLILSAGLSFLIFLLYRKMEQLLIAKKSAEEATSQYRESERISRLEKQFSDNIIASIPSGIIILDADLRVLKANKSFFELFPLMSPDIIGKPMDEIIFCRDSGENHRECEALNAVKLVFSDSEPTFDRIIELEVSGAGKRWFKFSTVGVQRKENEAMLIFDDITGLRNLEKDSEQRRLYMEAIFGSVPDAIVTLDDEHRIVEWNPGAERLFGYKMEEVVGKNIDELVTCVEKYDEAASFTRQVLNGGEIPPTETVRCRKDGSRVDVIVAGSPIRSESGLEGVVAVYTDISDRKRAERTIINAKQEWERTFDTVPDLIAILDNQRRIQRVNKSMADRLGTTPQELIGKTCYEVIHLTDSPIPNCPMEELLRDGKSHTYEFREDNLRGDFYGAVSPLFDSERKIQGCVLVLYDITRRKQAEQALHKSEERYRTLIMNQGEGLGVVDLEECFTFVNPAMVDIFGCPKEELIDRSILNFMDEENRATILKQTDIRKTGVKSSYEIEIIRPSGEKRILTITASPLFNEHGEFSSSFAVFRDITDRKLAEAARDRSHREAEELRNLIVSLNSIYILDETLPLILKTALSLTELEGGGIFLVKNNGKYARLMYTENVSPETAALVQKVPISEVQEDVKTKRVSSIELDAEDPSFIHQMGIKLGLKHIYIVPFKFRESLVGFLVMGTKSDERLDEGGVTLLETLGAETAAILWRLQTEEALKASESFNRGIVTHSPVGILYLNPEGKIVYENPAIYRMLGMPEVRSSSYIGKHFQDVPMFRNVEEGDVFARVAAGEVVEGVEVVYKSPTRQSRYLEIFASPRWGLEGRVIGAVVMCMDITNYKTLEMQLRQSQKMEAVGTLAGGIAHDFNNLLTGIMGNVELLLRKLNDSDPIKKDLERVQKSAERAAELTAQLLAFGRRRMEQPKPSNLNLSIDETFEFFRRTVDPRIEIISQKEPELWVVKADTGQMNQVLMNLMVNARDAMGDSGRVTIQSENVNVTEEHAREIRGAKAGEYVCITVTDTGSGIESEHIERIFEPFFSTKAHGKGTGLGLAMVYSIVDAHAGWIEVHTEVGAGTTFKIYLPRAEEEILPEEVADTYEVKGGNETILLVDDEEVVRNLGKSVLEEFGYQVILAADGVNALEIYQLKKDDIDLVILDLSMPRKSGRETLIDLLEFDPELRVIISSGFDKGGPVEELLKSGARGFVQKPYRMEQMLQIVRRALDADNNGKKKSV